MYTFNDYIKAIQWYFGSIKVDAQKYYKQCKESGNQRQLDYIMHFMECQGKLSFYND